MNVLALEKIVKPGLAAVMLAMAAGHASAATPPVCQKIVLTGEVKAGQEWRAAIGEGWVFRIVPIDSAKPGNGVYNGWDLVVDRERPAGFPDALLVATPPFNSINEREIGTTFGLRAQDAIGWNPRSFRFLTNPAAFAESQKLYQSLGARPGAMEAPVVTTSEGAAMQRQLKIDESSSAVQFRILDAHLSPGLADAAPFAQAWAIKSARMQHELEPAASGAKAALGELHWMKFSITLWLPGTWAAPKELHAVRTACSE